jgi:hypothetical protein
MERDIELLILRAVTLVFGVFGHIERPDGRREILVGGSGVFIVPFQALTARHVTRHLFGTDQTREDDLKRRVRAAEQNARRDYFELPHPSILYQGQFGKTPRALEWHVHNVWDSVLTDISFMEVNAEGDEAAGKDRGTAAYFEWSLLPPPSGSQVIMLGYPQAAVTTEDKIVNLELKYVVQTGQVTDVYEQGHDRGMYSFPCFRISNPVDHGFSGGPVFWGQDLRDCQRR